MIRQVIKGITVGAALLGIVAGTASAADYAINIYGASAQHKFWLNLAPDYLADKGCTPSISMPLIANTVWPLARLHLPGFRRQYYHSLFFQSLL